MKTKWKWLFITSLLFGLVSCLNIVTNKPEQSSEFFADAGDSGPDLPPFECSVVEGSSPDEQSNRDMSQIPEHSSPEYQPVELFGPDGKIDCKQVIRKFEEEWKKVNSCTKSSECGQLVEKVSCGCTRVPVARKNADLASFYKWLSYGGKVGCLSLGSTCDCPEADGFICKNGSCQWNYK